MARHPMNMNIPAKNQGEFAAAFKNKISIFPKRL
jgi:hypothetical protein